MRLKKKFDPEITRIKLNPEQAILVCPCYNTGSSVGNISPRRNVCQGTTPQDKAVVSNQKYASGGTFS